MQAELIRLMGRTDSLSNKILSSRGVVRVLTGEIVIVSDTTTCRRATDAYSTAIQIPSNNRLVYAVRAGVRYLVIDPSYKAGEWRWVSRLTAALHNHFAKFLLISGC